MEDAEHRLRLPATAIVILASLNALLDLLGVVGVTLANLPPMTLSVARPVVMSLPRPGNPELGVFTLLLFLHGFQAFASVRMRYLASYRLAAIGALTVCIPCLSPLLIAGIPFGLWAVALLCQAETRIAFDLAKEQLAKPPQQPEQ